MCGIEDCHGLVGASLDVDKTEFKSVEPIEGELRQADCALILPDYAEVRLNYVVARHTRLIVDARHRLQEITSLRGRLVRL
jgi:hypothetical protein